MPNNNQLTQADLACFVRVVGIDDSPEHLALLGPQITSVRAAALRLREIELAGDVGPAVVYRAREEE